MKVALLTYFKTLSYGATLQTYATIKAIESLGHEVILVNIDIPNAYNRMKGILLFPKWVKVWMFRRKHFNRHLTRKYSSSENLKSSPPQADLYMIGSDQTWNLDISLDKASSFFLDFVRDNKKKVSYAASFGKAHLESTRWMSVGEVENLLRQFEHIAVRESSGRDILNNMGIDSIQVLDSALLFNNYKELTGEVENKEELVLFKVDNSKNFYRLAAEVGACASLPICSLGSLRRIRGMHCPYPYGIEGWLRRLIAAKYIMTDSFHALVLCLLYHKQFILIIGDPKRSTRLSSLAHLVGLDDRIMSVTASAEEVYRKLQTPIDYKKIDEILEREREKSIGYLKSILQ